VAPTTSITNIIWTLDNDILRSITKKPPPDSLMLPIRKHGLILYRLSALKLCCLLPKLRLAELASLRLQHHLLERLCRPFQCLQLVPVLTTHPYALPCLYVWVRHCARLITICGMAFDSSGVHGLSCRKSAGCGARHTDIISIVRPHCPQRKCQVVLNQEDLLVTTRRRDIDAMEELLLSNMGRHLSRYSGCKLSRQSCHGPGVVATEAETRK